MADDFYQRYYASSYQKQQQQKKNKAKKKTYSDDFYQRYAASNYQKQQQKKKNKAKKGYTLKTGEGLYTAAQKLSEFADREFTTADIAAQNNIGRRRLSAGMTLSAPRTARGRQRAYLREYTSAALNSANIPAAFRAFEARKLFGSTRAAQMRMRAASAYPQMTIRGRRPTVGRAGAMQLRTAQAGGAGLRAGTCRYSRSVWRCICWNGFTSGMAFGNRPTTASAGYAEDYAQRAGGTLARGQTGTRPSGYASFLQGSMSEGGARFAGPMGSVATSGQQFARGILPQMLTAMDVQYLTDPRMAGGPIDMALIAASYYQDEHGNYILLEDDEITTDVNGYGSGYGSSPYGGYGGYGYGGGGGGGGRAVGSGYGGYGYGPSGRRYDSTSLGPISWRI